MNCCLFNQTNNLFPEWFSCLPSTCCSSKNKRISPTATYLPYKTNSPEKINAIGRLAIETAREGSSTQTNFKATPNSYSQSQEKASTVAEPLVASTTESKEKDISSSFDTEKTKEKEWLVLNSLVIKQAQSYINDQALLSTIPKINNTWLPNEMPIVLKAPGNKKAKEQSDLLHRFNEEILKRGFTSFIIPNTLVYGDFFIQEKMEDIESDAKKQICFYVKNHHNFDEVARNLTILLCTTHFEIKAVSYMDPFHTDKTILLSNYKDINLSISKGKGILSIKNIYSHNEIIHQKEWWCQAQCQEIIRLFPFQFEIIMGAARQVCSGIMSYEKPLKTHHTKILNVFDRVATKEGPYLLTPSHA